MTVVGTREDGRLRRHGARAQGHGVREGAWKPAETYGEWQTRTGDIFIPKIATDEPLRLECQHFLALVAGERRPRARSRATALAVVRALELLTDVARMAAEIHPTAIVYPGTVLGEGVQGARARRRRQAAVARRRARRRSASRCRRREIGDGTIVSTGAIVFAGSTIGARVIVGDQSCVRERVTIGDDVVHRPRLARRERHDDRRADEDPGRRVHHRVLDARGATSSSRRAS